METTLTERASTMTVAELTYARLDCVSTAEAMDSIDRVDGLDRAGRYRDEAAVYVAELNRRSL